MVEDMDPKELLIFQKKQLRKRLGLEAGDFMDMGDMLGDDDFVISAEQAKRQRCAPYLALLLLGLIVLKRAEEEAKKKTQEVASLVNTAGMSGRERYMAKRRQRNAPKKDNLRESQENLNASTGISSPFCTLNSSN
jgi:hypothetical protein